MYIFCVITENFVRFVAGTPRSLSLSVDQDTPERSVIREIIEEADVSSESEYELATEDESSGDEEDKPSTSTHKRRGPKEKPLPPAVLEQLKSKN